MTIYYASNTFKAIILKKIIVIIIIDINKVKIVYNITYAVGKRNFKRIIVSSFKVNRFLLHIDINNINEIDLKF